VMCYHVQVENRIASLVVDATDAEQLAQFWAEALGWQVVNRGSYGVSIGVDDGPFEIDFRFVPDGPEPAKNRLHLDVRPSTATSRPGSIGGSPSARDRSTSAGGTRTGTSWPIQRATSSACAVPDAARRKLSRV
jgi:Glyoxalase-like domain